MVSTAADLTALDARLQIEAKSTLELHDAALAQAKGRERRLAEAAVQATDSPDMRLRLLEELVRFFGRIEALCTYAVDF